MSCYGYSAFFLIVSPAFQLENHLFSDILYPKPLQHLREEAGEVEEVREQNLSGGAADTNIFG